jgi:hypothetical protein
VPSVGVAASRLSRLLRLIQNINTRSMKITTTIPPRMIDMIAVLVTTDERPARASAEATESSFVVEAGALLDAVVEAEMLFDKQKATESSMCLLVRWCWCCVRIDVQATFPTEEVHFAGGSDCPSGVDIPIFSTSKACTAIYLRQPCYTCIPAIARQEHDCDSRAYIGALVRRLSGWEVTQSHFTKLITESRAECKCAHIFR